MERRSFLKGLFAVSLAPVVMKTDVVVQMFEPAPLIPDHLIRSQLWSSELKKLLLEELFSQKWTNIIE